MFEKFLLLMRGSIVLYIIGLSIYIAFDTASIWTGLIVFLILMLFYEAFHGRPGP